MHCVINFLLHVDFLAYWCSGSILHCVGWWRKCLFLCFRENVVKLSMSCFAKTEIYVCKNIILPTAVQYLAYLLLPILCPSSLSSYLSSLTSPIHPTFLIQHPTSLILYPLFLITFPYTLSLLSNPLALISPPLTLLPRLLKPQPQTSTLIPPSSTLNLQPSSLIPPTFNLSPSTLTPELSILNFHFDPQT